jgi:hypothetical protein
MYIHIFVHTYICTYIHTVGDVLYRTGRLGLEMLAKKDIRHVHTCTYYVDVVEKLESRERVSLRTTRRSRRYYRVYQ